VGIFFFLLLVNIVAFIAIIWRLQLLWNSSNLKEKHKKQHFLFYALVFFALGFWRIPTIPYFIFNALQMQIPVWSLTVQLIFLPSEGFVLCCFFGWKFNLISKTLWWIGLKKHLTTTSGENDSALNTATTDGQKNQLNVSEYGFSE
jgi:hypothetical protein